MDLLIYEKTNEYLGKVTISGAKNSAVALIPACLLTSDEIILNNIPNITDVLVLIKIIKALGHYASFEKNTLRIKRGKNYKNTIDTDTDKLRASYYFIGSYLGFHGNISIKESGGCNLGKRPVNYHIDNFKKLGVNYYEENDYFIFEKYDFIKNNKSIKLPFPSVGTTINLILYSVLKKGKTIISNIAIEPEVICVCNLLKQMGANLKIKSRKIIIKGVNKLHGTTFNNIPDRIEAATFMALVNKKSLNELTLNNINHKHLKTYISIYKQLGYKIIKHLNSITIQTPQKHTNKSINIVTKPYPGFSTDNNPILTSLLIVTPGTHTITETIYNQRFSHIHELNKLGANISYSNNIITIKYNELINNYYNNGNNKLHILKAYDLRCSASLVVGAINSNCKVLIKDIDYLFRGYEDIITKLLSLGIKVELLK